jgi:dolichyl-phosphate-mannose-protein mannosyltransferase
MRNLLVKNHSTSSEGWSPNIALAALALGLVALHTCTNGQYGFHRDELATLDDARSLAWGYVAYPPVTPFFARIALEVFGVSLRGARFFPAIAQSVAAVLTGLMARELGGSKFAQFVAAMAAAISPLALSSGALLQYVAFDYLWWVLTAYFVVRLLRSKNPRWWIAVGASIGLGMLTKYSMMFLVAGIFVGIVIDGRAWLTSRWLWYAVVLSIVIFVPNLIWQVSHHFISLDFLRYIHARDVRIGRTDSFISDQFILSSCAVTLPLWLAGLVAFLFAPALKPYRFVALMYLTPLFLFVIAKGRGYYLAPAYPMLLAAGAVAEEKWLATLAVSWNRFLRAGTIAVLAISGVMVAFVTLPIVPINSRWWNTVSGINGDFREEVGWPELVAQVAKIRDSLGVNERANVAILAANYGEAGAIDLYGPAYALPKAISGVNSFWQRGYGDAPPQLLIVLGLSREDVESIFQSCELAGHSSNIYGVRNEETAYHPDIFVCRNLRGSWPDFWKRFRHFG